MKMKRPFRYAVVLLATMAIAVGGVVWWTAETEKTGITYYKFARVKNGMTEQEVEAIFGEPPSARFANPAPPPGTYSLCWIGHLREIDDAGNAQVAFDANGKVIFKGWIGAAPRFATLMHLRAALGL